MKKYLPGMLSLTLMTATYAQDKNLPAEFEQILPRGRIAAINQPQFVSASEASISKDSWVLGVTLNGITKAYSLNLLNSHEIVNDRFGDKPVAAVW